MTIKDAVFRELKYGLCRDGALSDLVDPEHVKLDMRGTAATGTTDYPWIIFGRQSASEDNQIRYARDRFDIALIGSQSIAAKGDDLLEQIRGLLIDHFAGKMKTWGKFTALGVADPTGGLKMKCVYTGTSENFDPALCEKMHLLSFTFAYIR